jgi:hypothetical protein
MPRNVLMVTKKMRSPVISTMVVHRLRQIAENFGSHSRLDDGKYVSIYRRPAIRHEYWRTIGPWMGF